MSHGRPLFPAFAMLAATCALVPACGAGAASSSGTGGAGASTATTTSTSGGTGGAGLDFDAGLQDGSGGGSVCVPPDVLILLDRTLSMHFTPSGANPTDAPHYTSSKWSQAVTAIESLAAAPLDGTVRFGLELWPPDPGGGACITLAERVEDTKQATNPACQDGEVVVPPALGTGAQINSVLDPETTRLCITTPTGKALAVGSDYLKAHAEAGRAQFQVLVTDGADWDLSCPDPNPIPIVQALAAGGLKTYVVGFFADEAVDGGAGVGKGFLNDMACAGQTATGFPAPCKQVNGSWVAADPNGPDVFLHAGSGADLSSALNGVAAEICCNCVK